MTTHEFDATKQRLKDLGLFGLLGCWESIAEEPVWLARLLGEYRREALAHRNPRHRRTRTIAASSNAGIGRFPSGPPPRHVALRRRRRSSPRERCLAGYQRAARSAESWSWPGVVSCS